VTKKEINQQKFTKNMMQMKSVVCWKKLVGKNRKIPAVKNTARLSTKLTWEKRSLGRGEFEKNAARNCNLINEMHRRLRKYAGQIGECKKEEKETECK